MYKLSSSMSDRINFDDMIKSELYQYNFDLKPSMAVEYFPNLEDFVDDMDEAKARIESVAKELLLENLAEKLDSINGPVVVFDTGSECLGEFKTGAEAADAVRNSNKSWWVMVEPPAYEVNLEISIDANNVWINGDMYTLDDMAIDVPDKFGAVEPRWFKTVDGDKNSFILVADDGRNNVKYQFRVKPYNNELGYIVEFTGTAGYAR